MTWLRRLRLFPTTASSPRHSPALPDDGGSRFFFSAFRIPTSAFFYRPASLPHSFLTSSLARSPTKKYHYHQSSIYPHHNLIYAPQGTNLAFLSSYYLSAPPVKLLTKNTRHALSVVNSMTILRCNTENRKELSRSKARIVSPGGCICSKERNGINVANTNQLF